MKALIGRRELVWVIGGIAWVAVSLEAAHLGVGGWYAFGLGSLAGAVTVVVLAALFVRLTD
jgi:hypothetical protein